MVVSWSPLRKWAITVSAWCFCMAQQRIGIHEQSPTSSSSTIVLVRSGRFRKACQYEEVAHRPALHHDSKVTQSFWTWSQARKLWSTGMEKRTVVFLSGAVIDTQNKERDLSNADRSRGEHTTTVLHRGTVLHY